jgi:flagellar hook protein FlgE
MGYSASGGNTTVVSNGTAGLTAVSIGSLILRANPSSVADLSVNLPADANVVAAADLPSANAATAAFTGKTSLVAYDNLGNEVTLDIYSAKTAANTWEVTTTTDHGLGGFHHQVAYERVACSIPPPAI